MSDEVGSVDWVHAQLFLGPLAEYHEIGFEFDLRPEPFRGSLLVEMLDAETVRLEWFDTHGDVPEFTSGALTYER